MEEPWHLLLTPNVTTSVILITCGSNTAHKVRRTENEHYTNHSGCKVATVESRSNINASKFRVILHN